MTIKEYTDLIISKESVSQNIDKFMKKIDSSMSGRKGDLLRKASDISTQVKLAEDRWEDRLNYPLYSVPFIVKDNYMVQGIEIAAASKVLAGHKSVYTATAVKKLLDAGAILVGIANMDEFAQGSNGKNSSELPSINSIDENRVAGGSSSGSATSIANELAVFSLGTDTGGSVRNPASYNGVVGYKPSYGSISRYGVIAMASSFDVIGPIANSVADVQTISKVLFGIDENDKTTINNSINVEEAKEIKIGYIAEQYNTLDIEVKEQFDKALTKLREKFEVKEVSIPSTNIALSCYYTLVPAEVSSNLARYDGLRYGSLVQDDNLEATYKKTKSELIGVEPKRRIAIGAYILSHGFYDAYYRKAMKLRTQLIREYNEVYKQYDILISPTTPSEAPLLTDDCTDPRDEYRADNLTVSTNLVGNCAVSIPVMEVNGMPLGLQVSANSREDSLLLNISDKLVEVLLS